MMKKIISNISLALLGLSFLGIQPTPVAAAVYEPLRLNVYIKQSINPLVNQTGWKVTAKNGASGDITLSYGSTTNDGFFHYIKVGDSTASSTGWVVRVQCITPGCSYDKTSDDHTLFQPSRWDVTSLSSPPVWVPVSGATIRAKAKKITGTLTKTYVRSERVNYYSIKPSSGSSLNIGDNIGKATWDPKYEIDETFTCYYFGTLTNPSDISCKKGTTPPGGGADDPGDPGEDEEESGGPVTYETGVAEINPASLDESKCPKNADGTTSSTYTKGILKGVPCIGAIDSTSEVLAVVKNVVMIFLLPLVGTLFIIMLLLGGILYITSRGNTQQLERAKKLLTAAIIGLLIVTLSYTIISIFANVIGGGVS